MFRERALTTGTVELVEYVPHRLIQRTSTAQMVPIVEVRTDETAS
jgi:hypothetical protein